MSTAPKASEQTTKFKTTLYLTENNRQRLEHFNKLNRTQLINQAIEEKLEALEKQERQQQLLNELDTGIMTPANGLSTEDTLHKIRLQEQQALTETQ